jgi:hypothetical protein
MGGVSAMSFDRQKPMLAGDQYDVMALPGIDHEVVVSFLGGDPSYSMKKLSYPDKSLSGR